MTTLWKIASGLNVSPSLLMVEEQQTTVQIIKADNFTHLIEDDGKYITSPFLPFDKETKFEVYTMELKPGCIHKSNPILKMLKSTFLYPLETSKLK
ncbi:hypothetical protein AAAC51_17965 [Priestia megaterium]